MIKEVYYVMDDDPKTQNHKIREIMKKCPKVKKYTCFGIISSISFIVLDILEIFDIKIIGEYINRFILFLSTVFKDHVICVSAVIIVAIIVFCICYCKRMDNKKEINRSFFKLFKSNFNNRYVNASFYSDGKNIRLTIEPQKYINENKTELDSSNIITFSTNKNSEAK